MIDLGDVEPLLSEDDDETVEYVIKHISENLDKYVDVRKYLKRVRGKQHVPSFSWINSQWMKMLNNPEVGDTSSRVGKLFRRRFRVPYTLFKNVLVPRLALCKDLNSPGCSIPLEMKILCGLRILGRDNDNDTISELSGISESWCRTIFKKFINAMKDTFFQEYVYFPEGAELHEIMEVYRKLGLPGACGSMDGTHIHWNRCPKNMSNRCRGKEHSTTLAFLAVVDHNRRILHCSRAYCGAANDKAMFNNDPFCVALENGKLKDAEFIMFDGDGVPRKDNGGWIIVDGGFKKIPCLIEPQRNRFNDKEVVFSEWLESVRKDIECTFGILKSRFRVLKNAARTHDQCLLENIMHVCCILHNMLLLNDGLHLYSDWENVNWDSLNPSEDSDSEWECSSESSDDTAGTTALNSAITRTAARTIPPTVAVGKNWYNANVPSQLALHNSFVEDLVTSFSVQRFNGDVKWPRNFSNHSKKHFADTFGLRLNSELLTLSALYVKPSDLLDAAGASIGLGLFCSIDLPAKTVLGRFNGVRKSRQEYEDQDAGFGYAIAIGKDAVLDCFEAAKAGRCKLSMANSANRCTNVSTGTAAKNNCRIVNSTEGPEVFKLKTEKFIPAPPSSISQAT